MAHSTNNLQLEGVDVVVHRFDSYKLDNLKPYAKNAKVHTDDQIAHLARSIELFGFQQPIVVDEHDVILAGHGRWLAAQKISLGDAPVWRVEGYTDEQKEAFRLADNAINQETGFDLDLYEELLESLSEADFPIADLGLTINIQDIEPEDISDSGIEEGSMVAKIVLKMPIKTAPSFEVKLNELLEDFPEVDKTKTI